MVPPGRRDTLPRTAQREKISIRDEVVRGRVSNELADAFVRGDWDVQGLRVDVNPRFLAISPQAAASLLEVNVV